MKKILQNVSKSCLSKLLQKYSNLYDLADNLGTTRHTLVNTLEHFSLPVPRRTLYSFNENFFTNINEYSMFFAGLLAADGCLQKVGKTGKLIKLKLSHADRDIVELFKKHIEATNPIYDVINNDGTKSSILQIYSAKMFDDLHRFGLTPRKTHTYIIPDEILNHSLFNHFMRGFSDGDGSFGLVKNKKGNVQSISFNITGVSPAILQMYNSLKLNCCITNDSCYYKYFSKVGTLTYTLMFRDISEVEKIINYLYNDATVFMKRKYDVANQITELKNNSNWHFFDPQKLQEDYNRLHSFTEVGKLYGCNYSIIKYQMVKLGLQYNISISKRKSKMSNVNGKELENKYLELGSIKDLANFYGCSPSLITQTFHRFGLNPINKRK